MTELEMFCVWLTVADEVTGAGSTCRDRCGDRYNSTLTCQCTSNCDRFRNCCPDYLPMCVGNFTGLWLFCFTLQIFYDHMSHNRGSCWWNKLTSNLGLPLSSTTKWRAFERLRSVDINLYQNVMHYIATINATSSKYSNRKYGGY